MSVQNNSTCSRKNLLLKVVKTSFFIIFIILLINFNFLSTISSTPKKIIKHKLNSFNSLSSSNTYQDTKILEESGVVFLALGAQANQMNCNAAIESLVKYGGWNGKVFLITDSKRCFDYKQILQDSTIDKNNFKLIETEESFSHGGYDYKHPAIGFRESRVRSLTMKTKIFDLIGDEKVNTLLYADCDIIFSQSGCVNELFNPSNLDWENYPLFFSHVKIKDHANKSKKLKNLSNFYYNYLNHYNISLEHSIEVINSYESNNPSDNTSSLPQISSISQISDFNSTLFYSNSSIFSSNKNENLLAMKKIFQNIMDEYKTLAITDIHCGSFLAHRDHSKDFLVKWREYIETGLYEGDNDAFMALFSDEAFRILKSEGKLENDSTIEDKKNLRLNEEEVDEKKFILDIENEILADEKIVKQHRYLPGELSSLYLRTWGNYYESFYSPDSQQGLCLTHISKARCSALGRDEIQKYVNSYDLKTYEDGKYNYCVHKSLHTFLYGWFPFGYLPFCPKLEKLF